MKMLYQNQINKIKNFISVQPNVFIIVLASVYLFPSLFLYFVSEDIKFAVLFKEHSFFENLRNIWFPSGEFLNKGYLFRPIISSINLIEYSLWGINPFGYHFINGLIHTVNSVLIYRLSLILLKNNNVALLSALIFIFHPILGHSIFWISGRTDMLALSFYLLSLINTSSFIEKTSLKKLILIQILFLCAMLTKEVSITLPLAQVWMIFWKKNHISLSEDVRQYIIKIIASSAVVFSIFLYYRFSIFNQNPFIIDSIYTIGGLSQLVTNMIKIGSFLTVPIGHTWFELKLINYKTYAIILMVPLLIKSCVYLFNNRCRQYKIIMLTVLLFISALPLFNLTMRWYLYIPVSFFSIVLAALIIKIKDKSRFAYLLLVAYLMIFILGSVLNYKIWLNNAQIGKEVVNGLEDQIKMNDNIETIAILNFPSKVNRVATFVDGFESLIRLITGSSKKIIRPTNVIHNSIMKPTDVNIIENGFIINTCEESSYFLLGDNEQRLGLRSFNPGDEVKISSGKVTIQKVNDIGKPVRVALKLDEDNFNKNTLFLKFDEITNTYKVIR
ncbi:MAG: glycosyltransferase family 39 protein [Candidatus Neomarinimicrobiota bacterium]